jgi:probable F420-dependent oxidoreductase
MKVDLMTGGLPLRRAQALAVDAERAGFDGMVVTEGGRTAYLTCTAAALAAPLDLATGVAVAFPRSPMVTAAVAWELAEVTGGRFRLGLGTQVRAHVERRYASEFNPPGPRLREYVQAVRACFRAFRGEAPLAFDGEYWSMNLLPSQWSPGRLPVPDPPIDVAAVNPWMLRMAAEVADGIHIHPLNTPTYLEATVVPAAGSAELIVPAFVAPGETTDDRERWRERVRGQVAFYGSTPNYAFIFEQLGRDGTTDRIRERMKAGDVKGMAAVIDDDLLAHFCVSGTFAEVADGLVARYGGIADRIVLYSAGSAWQEDPAALGPWGELARDVAARSDGGEG